MFYIQVIYLPFFPLLGKEGKIDYSCLLVSPSLVRRGRGKVAFNSTD